MKDDRLYLIHISECIDRIERYTGSGKTAFFSDTKTQDAVVRNLQTLGESARRISEPLKAKYPEVEWRSIFGFPQRTRPRLLGGRPPASLGNRRTGYTRSEEKDSKNPW